MTEKDLHRICRIQYEYPGSAIGYVYIVLEPAGSARLTFEYDLYYELCVSDDQSLFGVPNEITDMKRSPKMVET